MCVQEEHPFDIPVALDAEKEVALVCHFQSYYTIYPV